MNRCGPGGCGVEILMQDGTWKRVTLVPAFAHSRPAQHVWEDLGGGYRRCPFCRTVERA